MSKMRTKQALKALSALAQESRLAIFKALVRTGKRGLTAGEISELLDIAAPTLSFHLSHLSNAELVEHTRDGRNIIYTPNFESMQSLLEYLLERCTEAQEAKSEKEAS